MTSAEIRKLAKPLCIDMAVSVYNATEDRFIADGCITLKYKEALLAFADALDRCEKVKAKAREANATQTSLGCKSCVENFVKHVEFIETGVEK